MTAAFGQESLRHRERWLDRLGRSAVFLSPLTWATRNARTRGGRNADLIWRRMKKCQVSGHFDGRGEAACKTVGSAYVGSNPTPATTCENAP